jgi:hypothetical protein
LAVVVIGLACGTCKFTSAVIGCLATVGIMFYFWGSAFGTRHRYDLIVNIQWMRPAGELGELRQLLNRHSRCAHIASQRTNEGSPGLALSYRLLMRDPARSQELIDELRSLDGVAKVTSVYAGDESEM